MFNARAVDVRRKAVENVIRYNEVASIPEITALLATDHGITVVDETVRRDLEKIGAEKDARTGLYAMTDHHISRYDLYDILKTSIQYLLHGVAINARNDIVFLYCDMGTSRRFSHILEAIRQDEKLNKKKPWYDRMLAVHASQDDTVIIYFNNSTDGKKFFDKITAIHKKSRTFTGETPQETEFMRKILAPA